MCFFLTDINGVVTNKRLDQKQVHSLPANERVELPYFEETGQPTKDASVLYHRYSQICFNPLIFYLFINFFIYP